MGFIIGVALNVNERFTIKCIPCYTKLRLIVIIRCCRAFLIFKIIPDDSSKINDIDIAR